mmetsp:Transcript_14737/g.30161  ORF Transcript_14737/g.30161 Transcript_14737/m.30161 type:complete len:95 (-) Transcript_14737:3113-3397(-)
MRVTLLYEVYFGNQKAIQQLDSSFTIDDLLKKLENNSWIKTSNIVLHGVNAAFHMGDIFWHRLQLYLDSFYSRCQVHAVYILISKATVFSAPDK